MFFFLKGNDRHCPPCSWRQCSRPLFLLCVQQKGDGVIDKAELQEACDQASLHLDEKLLDQLFEYCDVDKDGLINYLEFANFLTWKDKTPLKEYEERVLIKGI